MEIKQSFSTSEVAAYCHVTADTIRKWAEAGRITVFKTPGGHRRIRREDLIRFLVDNEIPVHSDLVESGVKVLIVDDEQSIINIVRRFLEMSDTKFDIRVAMDGFEAGRAVGTFVPDVVFLDIRLPGLDGFEICHRIKTSEETRNINVVAMTGFSTPETVEKIVGLGATLCLSKPFSPDELREAFAKVGFQIN